MFAQLPGMDASGPLAMVLGIGQALVMGSAERHNHDGYSSAGYRRDVYLHGGHPCRCR